MTSTKDKAIWEIRHVFENMSNRVLSQLAILEKALKTTNGKPVTEDIFKVVLKEEESIDNSEIKLDKLITQSIVLYNPVASDLRQLFAIFRMVNNLERIGDLVVKIIKIMKRIEDSDVFRKSQPLVNTMLNLSSSMVTKSLLSFVNNDKDLALWTIKKDSEIDDMNHKLLSKLIEKGDFLNETDLLITFTEIRSIISAIERIGDHATNIAEASIYSILGHNIKHTDK